MKIFAKALLTFLLVSGCGGMQQQQEAPQTVKLVMGAAQDGSDAACPAFADWTLAIPGAETVQGCDVYGDFGHAQSLCAAEWTECNWDAGGAWCHRQTRTMSCFYTGRAETIR